MQFRILLWVLSYMLRKRSKKDPVFRALLGDKQVCIQLGCKSPAIQRQIKIADQRVSSSSSSRDEAHLTIEFSDAKVALATLRAKQVPQAFMAAMQQQKLSLQGDSALLMWFQGLCGALRK